MGNVALLLCGEVVFPKYGVAAHSLVCRAERAQPRFYPISTTGTKIWRLTTQVLTHLLRSISMQMEPKKP